MFNYLSLAVSTVSSSGGKVTGGRRACLLQKALMLCLIFIRITQTLENIKNLHRLYTTVSNGARNCPLIV